MKVAVQIDIKDDKIWAVTLRQSQRFSVQMNHPLPAARQWIDAYLAGEDRRLPPLAWDRCTPFQREVLGALLQTPFGKTTTYGQLANTSGRPRAARAVGNALGANPFPLFIPCHRVLAATGIGGFSCGLPIKEALLSHENA